MGKQIQKDPRILRRLIALDFVVSLIVLVDGLLDGRPLLLGIAIALFVSSLFILAYYIRQQMRARNH
jgi:hypothetical protein